jgi:hypothetical protein
LVFGDVVDQKFSTTISTMISNIARQRMIHRPTALAAFYWVTASLAASSSSFAFGFGGSPVLTSFFAHRPPIVLSKLRCGGSTATVTEQTTTTTTSADALTMSAQSKVDALRGRMKDLGLDVYLVPTDDPHLSGSYTRFHIADQ